MMQLGRIIRGRREGQQQRWSRRSQRQWRRQQMQAQLWLAGTFRGSRNREGCCHRRLRRLRHCPLQQQVRDLGDVGATRPAESAAQAT